MKHVQTFSPEGDTRTSEVFQGVIGILHSAMDELDLSGIPLTFYRRIVDQ
jgi:hypothetical protein